MEDSEAKSCEAAAQIPQTFLPMTIVVSFEECFWLIFFQI